MYVEPFIPKVICTVCTPRCLAIYEIKSSTGAGVVARAGIDKKNGAVGYFLGWEGLCSSYIDVLGCVYVRVLVEVVGWYGMVWVGLGSR